MSHNLFVKLILLVIVGLLAINLIWPLPLPSVTHAASGIQYKVVDYSNIYNDAEKLELLLNKYANDGWELVTLEPVQGSFIFMK